MQVLQGVKELEFWQGTWTVILQPGRSWCLAGQERPPVWTEILLPRKICLKRQLSFIQLDEDTCKTGNTGVSTFACPFAPETTTVNELSYLPLQINQSWLT